ncbi:AI-2E family transporter [Pullulanibacillus camelliae]|uniref:AI-2E family transporter n=2 Tax=Pullulanibacillus camelliae TaxID=1707096 RepID=A0A8J2YHK5_9BACL|nr:AI-2E family transporter [Pullulanibacillus camelliae]
MKKWTTLDWMKKLAVLILIFLNCWFLLKLFPYILHGFDYLIRILAPFLIACLIAYLLHPLIEGLHKQGLPRPLAILVIYLLFFGAVIFACIKGAPIVIEELKSFAKQGPHLQEMYKDNVNHIYYATSDFPETLHDHFDRILGSLENGLNQLVKRIILWIQGLFKSIFTILLIPFIVFYLLKDFAGVKNWLNRHVPTRFRDSGRVLATEIDESLGSYIRGQLLVCLVVAIVSIIGLWILHIPYALLLGIFIGITDIIPYFGPVIGAVPALLVAVTLSMKKVIFVLLLILIVQFLEGNIFSPLIVGKSVHIHPIFIMLALVIGGDIAGVVGMLIAVPIFVILRVFIIHFMKYRKKIDNQQET